MICWIIKFSVQTFQQSSEGVILCVIIGEVHQFIGHRLIPLDPRDKILLITSLKFGIFDT